MNPRLLDMARGLLKAAAPTRKMAKLAGAAAGVAGIFKLDPGVSSNLQTIATSLDSAASNVQYAFLGTVVVGLGVCAMMGGIGLCFFREILCPRDNYGARSRGNEESYRKAGLLSVGLVAGGAAITYVGSRMFQSTATGVALDAVAAAQDAAGAVQDFAQAWRLG